MYALIRGKWNDGYVPYHRLPGHIRISVRAWFRLVRVTGAYFESHGAAKVYNYILTYGLNETVKRVRSRLRERGRNEKYVALGIGVVSASDADSGIPPGTHVTFIAPCHPSCVSEVCLAAPFVRPVERELPADLPTDTVSHGDLPTHESEMGSIPAWNEHSGHVVPWNDIDRLFHSLMPRLQDVSSWPGIQRLPVRPYVDEAPVRQRLSDGRKPASRPTAIVFGLGHYAKTFLLPRIRRRINVVACHEVDPIQAGRESEATWTVRASPFLDPDERADVVFAAGFHHLHAPVATRALLMGSSAVIEKPPATTRADLDALVAAARSSTGHVFTAFQRRYSAFNAMIRADLALAMDTPVTMHAVAFEVPLPPRFWYRWPNSRGRIVCNGCHWLDYFLFLNGFTQVADLRVHRARNGDVHVAVDLENDASLSLTITEIGSHRLNVRDHIRLSAGSRNAWIVDQCRYESESPSRVLRRAKTSRADSFNRMYDDIAGRLVSGEAGDTVTSLESSGGLTLAAQELLDGQEV